MEIDTGMESSHELMKDSRDEVAIANWQAVYLIA